MPIIRRLPISRFITCARPVVRIPIARLYTTEATNAEQVKEASKAEEPIKTELKHPVHENKTTHSFKSSTKNLLRIVSTALYSQKQIFIRELISNAADAIEKRRLGDVKTQENDSKETEWSPKIDIQCSEKEIIIQDNGIGMSEEELHKNLGTIAESGSRAFKENEDTKSIIGQFGVGFYSAFMVGQKLTVYSRRVGSTEGHVWESEGTGEYNVAKAECEVGTKIVISLRDDAKEFGKNSELADIIKTHSNFVAYPIMLDGKRLNTIEFLWDKTPTKKENDEFYRFISKAWDSPQYTMALKIDVPMSLKAILYVPTSHTEAFGMGRMEPGVQLYSRKVLIQKDSNKLLPEWLRFVKGVVDSEDLPLNLSREMLQDSQIFAKINRVLTSKLLSHIASEAKKNPEAYTKWFADFGMFIKEGICTTKEESQKKPLSKLLRFRSSREETTSLQDYVARMPKTQKSIYYLTAPSLAIAKESPYLESFEKNGFEVLYMLETVDEFVASHIDKYNEFPLTHVEKGRSELTKSDTSKLQLPESEWKALEGWFAETLGKAVSEVKVSLNIPETLPGHLGEHESPMMRNLMKQMNRSGIQEPMPAKLELNAYNPIILGLNAARKEDLSEERITEMAQVAQQVLDTASISAGILEDPRSMVKRLNMFCLNSVRDFVPTEAEIITEVDNTKSPSETAQVDPQQKPDAENQATKEMSG